jgi:DNA polymerase-3 subunit gamma/tau
MKMCSIESTGYHDFARKSPTIKEKKGVVYKTEPEKPKIVEEKPAPPVQKPPEKSKAIPGTISIKNHKTAIEDKKEETEEDLKNKPADEFTQEQIEVLWKEVAKKYKTDKNLFSTLTKGTPKKKENFIIEYVVDNKIQKREIEERLIEFLPVIREKLNNYHLQVNVSVSEQPKNDKPYTPQEKFKKMADKNPALLKLKDQLDLEIDF